MSSSFTDTRNLLNKNNIIDEDQEFKIKSDEDTLVGNLSIGNYNSHIDIHGQPVPSTMLVALLDRPTEMKDLVSCNHVFYDTLYQYITETQGRDALLRFQDVLYKPREQLPDRLWINQISQFLSHNPVFWTTFKESVGYDEDDDNNNNEDDNNKRALSNDKIQDLFTANQGQSDVTLSHSKVSHIKEKSSNAMDLIKLRENPDFQTNLPKTHSTFFKKADQLLTLAPTSIQFSKIVKRNSILQDAIHSPVIELDEPTFQNCLVDENPADGLESIVCCTRLQEPDDLIWLNNVLEALSDWPELLDRLNDIALEV